MKIYILMMGGFLLSCNTSKLKTKYAARDLLTVASDSSFSAYNEYSFLLADSSTYDELWWLKGNARWHPDSGFIADELLFSYKDKKGRTVSLLDHQARLYQQKNKLQEATSVTLEEKNKEQQSLFRWPWYVYLLFVSVCILLAKRLKRSV